MSELKDCPFCRSDTVNDTSPPHEPHEGVGVCWVCPDCVACGPVGKTVEEATDLWNKRPSVKGTDQND